MKILHIGMGNQPAISREISKLGSYRFLDWTKCMELGPAGRDILKREIIKASDQCQPDITFLHIQRPGVIGGDVAHLLKGFVINYTYDVAIPMPPWYYEIGANIDLTIFCDEPSMWDLKAHGIEADFSHAGYDQMTFKKIGTRSSYGEIVFLGNNYDASQRFDLTQMRFDMVTYLKEVYGEKFKVYGNKWDYNDGNLMYKEQQEAECYRGCKIAINFSHFDLDRYTSDRMFRIMGCGAFCLSKWYPGIEKDFKDGVHLRVWRDFEELKTLIDYYLNHEEERIAIANAGYELALTTATWEIRIKNIIDMAKARMSKEYKSRVVRVQQQVIIKDPATGNMAIAPPPIIPPVKTPDPDPSQEEAYFQPENVSGPIHAVEFIDEIPVLQMNAGPNPKEYLKLHCERRIDYARLKNVCFFKTNNTNEVDVSVIIPVRGRSNFNKILVKHLKAAMEFHSEKTYAITFVEYSVEMEHRDLCIDGVNYINVPFGGYFNKCLAFNVGALFSNKAKYFLFHDLDIMVKKDFFKNIFKNLERTGNIALQPFRLRRVLYCNENLSRSMINGQVSINELHTKYPGITEPNLPEQMRAPGGSIFCPKEQFVAVGGYDPELFFGYSIEDQFFYDKLTFIGGIESCNDPGIEVFHLYHPPLWSSNPFLTHHHNIYLEFSKIPIQDKKAFYDLERSNIEKHIR